MSTMKTFIVIFFIGIILDELQSRPEVDWFDSVRTRLHHSQEVYTAVILDVRIPRQSDPVRDELYGKITRSMSTLVAQTRTIDVLLKESDFSGGENLSTSLLFIYYTKYFGDTQHIYEVMHKTIKIADFCLNYLLIVLRTSSNSTRAIENIQLHAWRNSILNIVIVEIRSTINLHRFPKKFAFNPMFRYCNRKFIGSHRNSNNDSSSQVIIHQFNPFINKFYHEEFSPELELFPNFAKDMHGYVLNVRVLNHPPYSLFNLNKKKNVMEISGPNSLLLETFAKKLNFTASIEESGEFVEFDITPALYGSGDRFKKGKIKDTIRSHIIMELQMRVLIPNKYEMDKKKLENILEISALTCIIIIIIWLAVILLKFDDKVWQLCCIIGLLFSIAVPRQPSRTYERILFLFVAMLGFIYSNDIYSSLTNLGVNHLIQDEYETLKEIVDSGLTPVFSESKARSIYKIIAKEQLNLTEFAIGPAKCSEMLLMHRNVCCIAFSPAGKLIERWKDPNFDAQLPVKYAKINLWSENISFYFRQGMPSRKNMNRIIDRLKEAGILSKWYSEGFDSVNTKIDTSDNAYLKNRLLQTNLLTQLIAVIVFGHSLATLVFIGELLTHRFGNAFKKKGKIK